MPDHCDDDPVPVVFISYRRSDASAYARLLYQELTRAESIDVFMDVDSIPPGADFVEEVRRALERCDVTLAVIGPRWLTVKDQRGRQRLSLATDHVRVELKVALESSGVVLPVLVGDAVMPEPEELPDELAALSHRNAINVHDDAGFKGDIERLMRFVQLTGWDSEARKAAEQGRWAAAVEALERIAAARPDDADIARRLQQARTQAEITGLQADLRRMHTEQQWAAVIALGQQLAKQDPRLADPDGLVTAAQAELAEVALADPYSTGLQQLDRGDRAAAAAAGQAAVEQAAAEPAPPAGTRSRRPTWLPVAIGVAVLGLLGFGILGLRAVLGGGGTDPPPTAGGSGRAGTPVVTSPTNTPSTVRESATSASPGPPVLTGPKNLTGEERVLLDRIPQFFVGGGSCSRMTAPDDRDIRPEQAAANLECRYPGGTAIVYSMFQSDEVMNRFFDARLQRRNLSSGEGSFGPMPGWQLNHCGDPDRGTGRIYGNRNTDPDVDAIRAEIGWVRDGFQTYAYAFRPKDDFADLFTWWRAAYGPVDSSPC